MNMIKIGLKNTKMTDRIKGFTVTLSEDVRDDDFENILIAVKMIKGVGHIEPSIVTASDHFERQRIMMELKGKLGDVIFNLK